MNIVALLPAMLVASSCAIRAADELPLITTSSRLDSAKLIAAGDDRWTFKTADKELVVPARSVVRFGRFVPPSGQHRLQLVAGGLLAGYALRATRDGAALESDLLGSVNVPRGAWRAMIFDMPADPAAARRVEERIAAAATTADTLLFTNGDELAGRFVSLENDQVAFESGGQSFAIDRSRLSAVVVEPRQRVSPRRNDELKIWVGLRDGSRLPAGKFITSDERVTIESLDGPGVSVAREAVVALQPLGGDAVYLSDLDDAGYRHIPFLSLAWDYQRDRNVAGGPLLAGGKLYLKGLGMHSAARVTYNLDGAYQRFQAELAIDDSTDGRGSVTCRVFLSRDDGSGKWEAKYESPVIRGGDKPVSVDVDVSGAKRISLLVDFADRGDELDHINWLDARLVR